MIDRMDRQHIQDQIMHGASDACNRVAPPRQPPPRAPQAYALRVHPAWGPAPDGVADASHKERTNVAGDRGGGNPASRSGPQLGPIGEIFDSDGFLEEERTHIR
jgi:hypothetical protein